MAVPPSYSDLGKAARDLFTKGFSECHCGLSFQCRNLHMSSECRNCSVVHISAVKTLNNNEL